MVVSFLWLPKIVGQMCERLWQFTVGCLEGLLRQFSRHPAQDARIERDGLLRVFGVCGSAREDRCRSK